MELVRITLLRTLIGAADTFFSSFDAAISMGSGFGKATES